MRTSLLILSLLTVTVTAIGQTTTQLSKQDKEKITKEVNSKYLLYTKLYKKYSEQYEEYPTHENYMKYRKYLYLYKQAASVFLVVSSANMDEENKKHHKKDSLDEVKKENIYHLKNDIYDLIEQSNNNIKLDSTHREEINYNNEQRKLEIEYNGKIRDHGGSETLEQFKKIYFESSERKEKNIKDSINYRRRVLLYRRKIDSTINHWKDSLNRISQ